MNLRLKRTPGLYVVGFMASGKSTIGRHLAGELGWSFFDLDEEIERAENTTIASIFDTRGEEEFRRVESAILSQHVRWIERGRPAVVALGGGAFAEEANRDLVLGNGLVIWLDCPLEVVRRRLGDDNTRPLAANRNGLGQLFDDRRPLYARADYRVFVDTDHVHEIVNRILALPLF